jgi:antitoxin MazE
VDIKEIAMETRIQKWGDSLALRIPEPFATGIHLEQGTLVEMSLRDGRLIVEPLHPSSVTLEDLLKNVTPENLHDEIDTGPAGGREVW